MQARAARSYELFHPLMFPMFLPCIGLTHVTPSWTSAHCYFLGPPVDLWVVFLEPGEPKDDILFPQAGHCEGGALHMPLVVENHVVRIGSLGIVAHDLNPRDTCERIVWLAE